MSDTESRRGKPEAVVFTPSSLEALGSEIKDLGQQIHLLAGDLRKKNRHGAIALNYFKPVTNGMTAMRKLVEEGEAKIGSGKVMTLVSDDSSLSAQEQAEVLRKIIDQTSGGARTPEAKETPQKKPKK